MKKSISTLQKWLWPALLAVQLTALIVMTLAAGDTVLDNDSAMVFNHLRGMVENHSIIIPGWSLMTTMELDCATLFAAPFYLVTRSLTFSFRLASVVIIACWCALVWGLAGRAGLARQYRAMACALVLTPYLFGSLDYWNMMYLNAAQYCIKVALPLLLLYLLLTEKPRFSDKILTGVYLAGVLLTAFSSGIYAAACGLVPVLLAWGYRWLKQQVRLTPYTLSCTLGSVAATAAGLGLSKVFAASNKGDSMKLVTTQSFHDNMVGCLQGMFQLFGGLAGQEIENPTYPVMSAVGIAMVLRFVFVVVLLLGCRYALRHLAVGTGECAPVAGGLIFIFFWNLAVLLLTDTRYRSTAYEYRYHLMGMVPLLMLLAVCAANRPHFTPARLDRAFAVGSTLLLAGVLLTCDLQAYRAIWKPDGTKGVCGNTARLVEEINRLNVTDVFVVQDIGQANFCAAVDTTHRYKGYGGAARGVIVSDEDTRKTDALYFTDPAVLVVPEDCNYEEGIPAYARSRLQLVGQVADYRIYAADTALPLDGIVGLPYGTGGMDYADSCGYSYQGEMDENRRLTTPTFGGLMVESPELDFHTETTVCLNYEVQGSAETAGVLRVLQGETVVAELPISRQATEMVSDPLPAGQYRLEVQVNNEVALRVDSLRFDAVA